MALYHSLINKGQGYLTHLQTHKCLIVDGASLATLKVNGSCLAVWHMRCKCGQKTPRLGAPLMQCS